MSDDTQETNRVDWALCLAGEVAGTAGDDQARRDVALVALAAEVRRLREENERAYQSGRALGMSLIETERDRLAQELERRNVAHVEPAIIAKDRDDWKARALAAEAERDELKSSLDRAIRGDHD